MADRTVLSLRKCGEVNRADTENMTAGFGLNKGDEPQILPTPLLIQRHRNLGREAGFVLHFAERDETPYHAMVHQIPARVLSALYMD
ncbi:MAG: hypothetical protein JWN14_679, partial [Chthonomonadales bacterium]|nr:hypothetical protein [Chthonomonadales bacterium]